MNFFSNFNKNVNNDPFIKTDDELKVILDNARKIKNDNDTKINNLIGQRINVEELMSRDAIYEGEERLAEINKSINNIQIETKKLINSNLRNLTVYIARTGNINDINDLLIDVNNEIASLNRLLVETHNESIDPDYKEPRLNMLTENLNFEKKVKPILENRIRDLSNQWEYDHDGLGGGKRSKRKSSKRKSAKRKSAKRKNSKKNRK